MNDGSSTPGFEAASADRSVMGRRRLLRIGAVAAPAVVTLSATRAYAQAVGSVACQATLPTNVCYPRGSYNPATDPTLTNGLLQNTAYCDGNSGTPDLDGNPSTINPTDPDANFAPPPSPNTADPNQLRDWILNGNSSNDQGAWLNWLDNHGNGSGGSCLASVRNAVIRP